MFSWVNTNTATAKPSPLIARPWIFPDEELDKVLEDLEGVVGRGGRFGGPCLGGLGPWPVPLLEATLLPLPLMGTVDFGSNDWIQEIHLFAKFVMKDLDRELMTVLFMRYESIGYIVNGVIGCVVCNRVCSV